LSDMARLSRIVILKRFLLHVTYSLTNLTNRFTLRVTGLKYSIVVYKLAHTLKLKKTFFCGGKTP